ncbi:hypothetical protein D3C76_1299950 [compost metagenome]
MLHAILSIDIAPGLSVGMKNCGPLRVGFGIVHDVCCQANFWRCINSHIVLGRYLVNTEVGPPSKHFPFFAIAVCYPAVEGERVRDNSKPLLHV